MEMAVLVDVAQDKGLGVFARSHFQQGDRVIESRRLQTLSYRTTYSVQWDLNTHVIMDEPAIQINHSCDPNLAVRPNRYGAYDFIARRPIRQGEELTFDYASTEQRVVSKIKCLCGAASCRGEFTGFEDLSAEDRSRIDSILADHLKAR